MHADESTSLGSDELVELLEELTLHDPERDARTGASASAESIAVDLAGTVTPADASLRITSSTATSLRLIRLAPRQLTAELTRPLGVGDLFYVEFGTDLVFESREASLVRCTACAETDDSRDDAFMVFLRPIQAALDIRRALSNA